MKNTILSILISLIIIPNLNSMELYRIYFTDKGTQNLEYQNDLYNRILASLDSRAVQRRKLNMNSDNIITNKDIPIYEKYLESLSNINVQLVSELTWYNYIIADIGLNNPDEIKNFPFVKNIQPVIEHYKNINNTTEYNDCGLFEYGNSFNHINMLNIPNLQRYGFTGKGVRIGFLDSGFDLSKHKSIINSNVKKSYDFIYRDSVVQNEVNDINGQDGHGSVVFATVASLDNSNYVGIAPNAEFYLAKTEDLRSETYYELDLFAEAIIWMENNGVDVINASLGYSTLDTNSLHFSDFDGNYSIAAKAVNDASMMGMICVIANGNNGDFPKTLSTPADADSSVAVGAIDADGLTLVGFSSNGPNSKGLMKPNLVAQGGSIFSITPGTEDRYNRTAGTSLSSPLIAGSIGLLKSIYPETSSYDLKQSLYKSADKYDNPDNRFGYGLPNVFEAVSKIGVAISPPNQLDNGEFKRLVFYIFPENKILEAFISVAYSDFENKKYPLIKQNFDNQYYVDIPKSKFESNTAIANVVVKSYNEYYYYPSSIEKFEIKLENDIIQCGVNKNELIINSKLSPENGFDIYPTIIENSGNINLAAVFDDNFDIILSVSDLNGRTISTESLNFGPGVLNKQFSVNILNSGAYFITLDYGGKQFHKKVIYLK